ncbi:Histone-lysine N-methyltransferase SETMAR, partial [Harpegnathos saltator]
VILHDNAKPHATEATKETILHLSWEIFPHAAYSSNLTLSNFHLFQSMQHALPDTHFSTVDDVRNFINDFVASKPPSFYCDGIRRLPNKWRKSIDNNGVYF